MPPLQRRRRRRAVYTGAAVAITAGCVLFAGTLIEAGAGPWRTTFLTFIAAVAGVIGTAMLNERR